MSTHFVEAERHLRTLHAMIAAGEGDSERADELREEATSLWKQLTLSEQQQLQQLSVELEGTARDQRESRGSATA